MAYQGCAVDYEPCLWCDWMRHQTPLAIDAEIVAGALKAIGANCAGTCEAIGGTYELTRRQWWGTYPYWLSGYNADCVFWYNDPDWCYGNWPYAWDAGVELRVAAQPATWYSAGPVFEQNYGWVLGVQFYMGYKVDVGDGLVIRPSMQAYMLWRGMLNKTPDKWAECSGELICTPYSYGRSYYYDTCIGAGLLGLPANNANLVFPC